MMVNKQYNVAAPGSLPVRLMKHQRRKMFAHFSCMLGSADSIIDVGATSDEEYDHSNYFVAWHPHKSRITAVGIDDAKFLESKYPGVTFVQADGRALPFPDKSFDYGHSSAVLEHVGNRECQIAFVRELWRVARKGIFLTTPNRWFPVEFHTTLPMLHWLPPRMFRSALRTIGKDFFASEDNLNLLTQRQLAQIADAAGIHRFRVNSVSLGGWPTNLLLVATAD